MSTTRGLNDTPWYACAHCADLIEAKQWRELQKRSLSLYETRTGLRPSTGLRIHTHETHQQFVQMTTGHRLPPGQGTVIALSLRCSVTSFRSWLSVPSVG
ncbi:hypothetical protein F9278_15005 [Streptomyces phaeolivaceus]|uniref:Uncharacterized protein n=1 Tax=Streptomyces phaeolivaceus TaxID=2653200 RepID=A0A5P8K3E9_9ACTN|nr:hypothetical protein [Streptomyces phaeolivaceus]QFQ97298.1 hypothetical protein F9278_15005 [Streptomyces phaeolivaceus]